MKSRGKASVKLFGAPTRLDSAIGGFIVLTTLSLVGGPAALAWDPATTHAGLTERALAASKFHAVLAHQLGRPLGSLEPLRLDTRTLDVDSGRDLKDRLNVLDSAGGYRPNGDGVETAGAWVRAGAVLAKTPPERGRHHFFEPSNRKGLDDGPGLSGTLHAARLTVDEGATVRDAATGLAFSLDGMSALDWLWAPQNDLGLPGFFDGLEHSVSDARPQQRETALVRSLMALGAVVAILEDAGQPAFVRNDFRGEFLAHDSGSDFERFVADRFGGVALPTAATPVVRPDIESFFAAGDGKGLAQATQQRFFSPGTIPRDFVRDPDDTPSDAVRIANQSLAFPEPKVAELDLRPSGRTRYVLRDGIRVLAYQCSDRRVHFFLDQSVHADVARRWLPEIEAYAAGLIDHLLRASMKLSVAGGEATVVLEGLRGQAAAGTTLHIFAEDSAGARKEIATPRYRSGQPETIAVPKDARKLAAFARGKDDGGVFVAAGEISLP